MQCNPTSADCFVCFVPLELVLKNTITSVISDDKLRPTLEQTLPDPAAESFTDTDLKVKKHKVSPQIWISPVAEVCQRTSHITGQRVKSQATESSQAQEEERRVRGGWTYIKPGFLWLLHRSSTDHVSVFITAVSGAKRILQRDLVQKGDLLKLNLGFGSKIQIW